VKDHKEDKSQDVEVPEQEQAQQLEGRHAGRTPVQQLQSRMGNSKLLQLRAIQARNAAAAPAAPIQRDGAPDWIRDQLGIGQSDEQNFEQVTQAREKAEDIASNVSLPSGGEKLDAPVQMHAEQHLGVGLGDVNVVKGADKACESMGAMAFASGNDVYLSSSVDTSTPDGQFTMMHELAHVAQQKKGETSGLEGLGGDEGKREHLESTADSAASNMLKH
jgi:hypothetical protein